MSEPIDDSMAFDNINKVNVHPSGPTEEDEMGVLASLYFYNAETGVFFAQRYGD